MNVQVLPSPSSIISNGWPESQSIQRSHQQYYPPQSPGIAPNLRGYDTPPLSAASTGGFPIGSRSASPAPFNSMSGRSGDYRNPSPPSSIAGGRSSNGSAFVANDISAAQRRKQSMMEETLGQHYFVLKRYLASTAQDEAQDAKPSRARDKLPRLSPTQFQELSTDVYDEFQRRQAVAARQNGASSPGSQAPPAYLLPVKGFYPERNQARQKLSTLPAPKFRHLARDVFYELGRRVPRFADGDITRQGSPGMRGPPSRSGTPNGVRGHPRQGSVTGQVFAGGADGPTQKSLQNNMIIPNKSYLVEDDDEDGESVYGLNKRDTAGTSKSFGAQGKVVADFQLRVEELSSKVEQLEKQLEEKDSLLMEHEQQLVETQKQLDDSHEQLDDRDKQLEEKIILIGTLETARAALESAHADAQEDARAIHEKESSEAQYQFKELRSELEAKLSAAQILNNSLQTEIDRARELHSEKDVNLQDLQGRLDSVTNRSTDDEQTKARYAALEQESQELQQDNQELQQELLEQQRVTDEVRREAAGFLQEMKTLSAQSHDSFEREEQLIQQVHFLEDQIAQWKDRFARSKAQKRAADMELTVDQPSLARHGFLHRNGAIADYHIIEYQVAIDEALRMSRMDPKGLLSHMKSVILAVKHITEDLEAADASAPAISKLLTKISGSACNYITATKNFVYSSGISPVSLVDASASHLTAAVVEAVHDVKMHPSKGVGEDDFVPEIPTMSRKHFSAAARSSASESVYSTNTTAPPLQYTRQPGLNPNGTLTNGIYQSGVNGNGSHGRNGSYASTMHSRNGSYAVGQPQNHLANGSYNGLVDSDHSRSASVASNLPPPSQPTTFTGFTLREQDDLANLTPFLEDQTSHLIESIQKLVSTIRSSTSLSNSDIVSSTINTITSSVSAVVSRTQAALDSASPSSPLHDAAAPSVKTLQAARERMMAVESEAKRAATRGVGDWKDVVNGLPPIAFEIAREVRELCANVGKLTGDQGQGEFA